MQQSLLDLKKAENEIKIIINTMFARKTEYHKLFIHVHAQILLLEVNTSISISYGAEG